MNDDLERIWKEAIVTYSRYPVICPEGLRKTMKDFSQDSLYPGFETKTFAMSSGALHLHLLVTITVHYQQHYSCVFLFIYIILFIVCEEGRECSLKEDRGIIFYLRYRMGQFLT
jgi:hypothetical protein